LTLPEFSTTPVPSVPSRALNRRVVSLESLNVTAIVVVQHATPVQFGVNCLRTRSTIVEALRQVNKKQFVDIYQTQNEEVLFIYCKMGREG
jgi:hypothetical protein